jgi:hypothetical protein
VGRARDRAVPPERGCSEHSLRQWLAQARGAALPPIEVLRLGDEHIVRDGHHRVSVARDDRFTTIDADVVELGP